VPVDASLIAGVARRLALWMSYEDVIRVAQTKVLPERLKAIRKDLGARPDQVVRVTEFLKPSVEELCQLLPPSLARPLLRLAERSRWKEGLRAGLRVRTTTLWGFFQLWTLSRLRWLRRRSHYFREEQREINAWLDLVADAARVDRALAIEAADCARLVRGYGETRKRGRRHYARIVEGLIRPALRGEQHPAAAAAAVAAARSRALAFPEEAGEAEGSVRGIHESH
jgi:indolepyruvate ferredoxin oxidoreductase beta subunit